MASSAASFEHIRLAYDIAVRDLAVLHKRSTASWLWLLATPVAYLAIYWTVFAGVLDVRWTNPNDGTALAYAVPLFAGLTVYLYFADVVMSSTHVFVSKRTYVRRSAFPIWVLWLSNLMRCSIQAGIYLGILILLTISQGLLSVLGLIWLVATVCIIVAFLAGLSLLLATVGAFLGDAGEVSRLVLRVLFYAAPVTYPLSMVPAKYQAVLWLNPLTYMAEAVRDAALFGTHPDPFLTLGFVTGSIAIGFVAAWVFLRVRGAIADVV